MTQLALIRLKTALLTLVLGLALWAVPWIGNVSANGGEGPDELPLMVEAMAWCSVSDANIQLMTRLLGSWDKDQYVAAMADLSVQCIDTRVTPPREGPGAKARGPFTNRYARSDFQVEGGPCYSFPVFLLPSLGEVFTWVPCGSEDKVRGVQPT